MLSYLQKFNELPEELKSQVSSDKAMENIATLEKKYGFSLATVVMRVMVREISILDLAKFFVFENKLDARQAEKLVEELKEKVFFGVASYLGFSLFRTESEDNSESSKNSSFLDELKPKTKTETNIASSNFFFSSEDEEEVKELAKKLENFKVEEKKEEKEYPQIDISLIAEKTMKDSNTSFGSQDLIDRFKSILATYIRGVRNKVDTKHTLTKPINSGGLEISEIYADNILSIADFNKKEAESSLAKALGSGVKNREEKSEVKERIHGGLDLGARDIDYDFSKMTAAPKKIQSAKEDILHANQEKQKSARNISLKKQDREEKISDNQEKTEILNLSKKETGTSINPPRIKDIAQAGGKVKMEDVKYVPKLTGPIDELREMDLINFRRLSSDPKGAANKINDKINFLEDESYSQRLAGIKAWRESPVNQMYLQAGKESIKGEGHIKDIIRVKNINNNNFLSEEEMEAIMELNRKLRF